MIFEMFLTLLVLTRVFIHRLILHLCHVPALHMYLVALLLPNILPHIELI